MRRWEASPSAYHNPEGEVTIAIVGKYTGLKDAYKSLIEALDPRRHGQPGAGQARLDRERDFRERAIPAPHLEDVHGILVPGGFGAARRRRQDPARRKFARERKVPYFGICFGMQMAVIEAAARWPACRREFHRIRPDRRAGRRPDDRMAARQRARAAPSGRRSRRHDAARRLSARAEAGFADRRDLRRDAKFRSAIATATRSTPPIASGSRPRA